MAEAAPRPPIESGVPDPIPYMHPLMVKNYGKWAFHSHPKPGVLYHRAESGDEIWTVKAGTARQMDHYTVRELADIADKYADGFVRFTIRSANWLTLPTSMLMASCALPSAPTSSTW